MEVSTKVEVGRGVSEENDGLTRVQNAEVFEATKQYGRIGHPPIICSDCSTTGRKAQAKTTSRLSGGT